MSSTPPIGTDNSNDPIYITGVGAPVGIHAPVSADSLGKYETLSTFLKFILGAQTATNQVQYDIGAKDADQLKKLTQLLFERSQSLQQAQAAIAALQAQVQALYLQQIQFLNQIAAYNQQVGTMNAAADALNAAIIAYNNANPPTALDKSHLNNALSFYIITVANPTDSYNAARAAYDALGPQVAALNIQLAQYGMPPVVLQPSSPPTFPTDLRTISSSRPPPLPTLSTPFPAIIPFTTPATPLTPDQAVATYLPAFAAKLDDIFVGNDTIFNAARQLIFNQDVFQPNGTTLNDFTINDTPDPSLDTSGAGPDSAGSSMISISVGLATPYLEGIIANANYGKVMLRDSTPIPTRTVDIINGVAFFVLSLITSAAGTSTQLQKLRADEALAKVPGGQLAYEIQSAAAFAGGVRNLVNSDFLSGLVSKVIYGAEGLAGLPLADKKNLAEAVTAAVNLNLLNVGLLQVSHGLGLPGLVPQILGNIYGAPPQAELFRNNQAVTLIPVLENTISQGALKRNLGAALAGTGADPQQAGSIIEGSVNGAINAALSDRSNLSLDRFKDELGNRLQANGVPLDQANPLVAQAGQFIQTEIALPQLNRRFVPQITPDFFNLREASSKITSGRSLDSAALSSYVPGLDSVYPPGSPNRTALTQFIYQGAKRPEIFDAVNAALSLPQTTVRAFRDGLVAELGNRGINGAAAEQIATDAAKAIAPANLKGIEPEPLQAGGIPDRLLKPSEIVESLNAVIGNQLGPAFNPHEVQQQTSRLVIGLLSDFNEQIRILKQEDQQAAVQDFIQNAALNSQPSLPKIALTNQLSAVIDRAVTTYMNPAAMDTITSNNPFRQPMGWQKRDIAV